MLSYLQVLSVQGNRLQTLDGIDRFVSLQYIDAQDNEIQTLACLPQVKQLYSLNIQKNPIMASKFAIEQCASLFIGIRMINGIRVAPTNYSPTLALQLMSSTRITEQQAITVGGCRMGFLQTEIFENHQLQFSVPEEIDSRVKIQFFLSGVGKEIKMLQFTSRVEKDQVIRVIIVPERSAGLTVAALITYQ